MKNIFFACLSGLYFISCTSPVDSPPADIISSKQMTHLLFDIHVVESRVENMGLPQDTAVAFFKKLQKEVLKKHGLTEEKFYRSYDFYATNVSELDKIYEKVVDSLSVNEVQATGRPLQVVPQQ